MKNLWLWLLVGLGLLWLRSKSKAAAPASEAVAAAWTYFEPTPLPAPELITPEKAAQVAAAWAYFEPTPPAATFDPWVYDVNHDGYIQEVEYKAAVFDYFDGLIDEAHLKQVATLPRLP